MSRRQFSLKTLFWLMALVAAFCAGSEWGGWRQTEEIKARFHRQHLKVPEEVDREP